MNKLMKEIIKLLHYAGCTVGYIFSLLVLFRIAEVIMPKDHTMIKCVIWAGAFYINCLVFDWWNKKQNKYW